MDTLYYNEACATCGLPADLHLGPDDPIRDTLHTTWGDVNKCRNFVRCNPPRPAYGVAWWERIHAIESSLVPDYAPDPDDFEINGYYDDYDRL